MPFTPLPNHLLDEWMPRLSDTEWRLLCVVARQTLGWRADSAIPRKRKTRDWLSHRQLCARTGRASAAVSKAVDSLVGQGLLQVCDDAGAALLTPAARRRSASRLFYALGALAGNNTTNQATTSPSEKNFSQNEKQTSQSGFRKAKTTKETDTKNSKEELTPSEKRTNQPITDSAHATTEPLSEVHRFLRAYRDGFRRHSPHGEPPVIDWGKDGKLAKQLLSLYSYERLAGWLEKFLNSQDEWTKQQGYSLHAFKASIGRYLVQEGAKQSKLRDAINNPITIYTPGWKRAGKLDSSG